MSDQQQPPISPMSDLNSQWEDLKLNGGDEEQTQPPVKNEEDLNEFALRMKQKSLCCRAKTNSVKLHGEFESDYFMCGLISGECSLDYCSYPPCENITNDDGTNKPCMVSYKFATSTSPTYKVLIPKKYLFSGKFEDEDLTIDRIATDFFRYGTLTITVHNCESTNNSNNTDATLHFEKHYFVKGIPLGNVKVSFQDRLVDGIFFTTSKQVFFRGANEDLRSKLITDKVNKDTRDIFIKNEYVHNFTGTRGVCYLSEALYLSEPCWKTKHLFSGCYWQKDMLENTEYVERGTFNVNNSRLRHGICERHEGPIKKIFTGSFDTNKKEEDDCFESGRYQIFENVGGTYTCIHTEQVNKFT